MSEAEGIAPWKAHEVRWPGMATSVKLSQQPRTESCVVPGNGHSGTQVNGMLAPKSRVVGVADPVLPGIRRWRVSRGASGVRTAGMQLKDFM